MCNHDICLKKQHVYGKQTKNSIKTPIIKLIDDNNISRDNIASEFYNFLNILLIIKGIKIAFLQFYNYNFKKHCTDGVVSQMYSSRHYILRQVI